MRVLVLIYLFSTVAFSQLPPIEPGVSHELAKWRAAHYSDVRYKLNLTLEKMSPVLKGTIEIRVKVGTQAETRPLGSVSDTLIILDWRKIRGHEQESIISNVTVNGSAVAAGAAQPANAGGSDPNAEARALARAKSGAGYYEESSEHLIFRDGVVAGENVIKLDFTSPILTSGSAITRYVDKEDGAEYIYSLFVPSDASTAFPVFDQPDLKARFRLTTTVPYSWQVISNTGYPGYNAAGYKKWINQDVVGPVNAPGEWITTTWFEETKPISTYVFAFAAGPFEEFTDAGGVGGNPSGSEGAPPTQGQTGTLPTGRVSASTADLSSHIYVRKSQAKKFGPHSKEVFRLTREGVKYLEEYFDYKFPWPKYDIVLIPEFPFGGMEHAGATFLRETGVIFPQEPTKGDYISRANLIFHETAHQWFGDTVTMKWFDDLWLKEGFAEFMAYKTLEKVMPEANAWKVFYERNKQAAYLTDSTHGTTPIYQEIANLSAAKSAYGNIVYRKAPSFLRQAEFYLGEDKFQTAVRAFLKKHAFANATWEDLVAEFEVSSGEALKEWAEFWVKRPGVVKVRISQTDPKTPPPRFDGYITLAPHWPTNIHVEGLPPNAKQPLMKGMMYALGSYRASTTMMGWELPEEFERVMYEQYFIFPNYQDYGYGIFLLDDKSRDYVLKNIQNEKDDFLRSMMWGALWDSVREAELDPREYVELAINNLPTEKDETITASVLGRVSTAMTYYIQSGNGSEPPPSGGGQASATKSRVSSGATPSANTGGSDPADLQTPLEAMLIDRMRTAPTLGHRVTYYRAFLNIVSTENGRNVLKQILKGEFGTTGRNATVTERAPSEPARTSGSVVARYLTVASLPVKTKDRFDIVTKLAILGDPDAAKLLADLEKTETSDDAKRYAYAAKAAFPTKDTKEKFWNDFINNKDISESWIEAAMNPFNSPRHADLTLPYLVRALAELPNLKRNRKIFFVNGWLGAFIGGQKSQLALDIVNKFLADSAGLDRDLRLKILENVDVIERAVKIRTKFGTR